MMGPQAFGMLHKINRGAYRTRARRVKAWRRYERHYRKER